MIFGKENDMEKRVDLRGGPIGRALMQLALPLMATSLVQMAYNLTDMIWIGRVSAGAVAAVGVAGMFNWLSSGLVALARVGGQVRVGHCLGAGNEEGAVKYACASIQMCMAMAVVYGAVLVGFAPGLIGFFKLNSPQVVLDAQRYLQVIGLGMPLVFFSQLLTALLTVTGDSRTPFRINAVGLVANIVLDPLFIFGLGPLPALGAVGAGIATVLGQLLVAAQFLAAALRDRHLLCHVRPFSRPDFSKMADIASLSLPAAFQNALFPLISMVISRMVAGFGDEAVAVQKVGSQVESITWITADGFAAAVNSFVAQNWGARDLPRARRGFFTALGLISAWGLFTTALLLVLAQPIFSIFIDEPAVVQMGVDYLEILAYSQLFMCWESVVVGAFAGVGRTLAPAVVCSTFTVARIPMAMLLTATALGLCGIWWSITISSVVKGVLCLAMFLLLLRKLEKQGR